jgi:hypothetical protein
MTELHLYFENIILELENYCLYRDDPFHAKWTLDDIKTDIIKCRNYCYTNNGYVWKTPKLCEFCDKILKEKLSVFNKSNHELISDNFILENKLNKLSDKINDLENNIKNISDNYEKLIIHCNKLYEFYETYKNNTGDINNNDINNNNTMANNIVNNFVNNNVIDDLNKMNIIKNTFESYKENIDIMIEKKINDILYNKNNKNNMNINDNTDNTDKSYNIDNIDKSYDNIITAWTILNDTIFYFLYIFDFLINLVIFISFLSLLINEDLK